jgi:hypothetical protein
MDLAKCALFSLLALRSPFSDCGDSWSRRVPPPPTQGPAKPPCLTDPPWGCVAICAEEDPDNPTWVSFTDNCKDISAGPRTAMFEASVGTGGYMCTLCEADTPPDQCDSPLNPLLPADVGIATQQVEFSDACTPP